jgi:hypothetical protein
VTLLATLLTNALLFVLFLAFGVLIAPALRNRPASPPSRTVIAVTGTALGVLLAAFAVMSAAAHLVAVGGNVDDPILARDRVARAAALAPWDTGLRNLRYETSVQAALAAVFGDSGQGPALVDATADTLESESRRIPEEYLFPYQSSLLLIGSGQRLGVEYTRRGIEAGERGLKIYPNSLELGTGLANGYLQLDRPEEAKAQLEGIWDADPNYLPAGLAYTEALAALGERAEAAQTLETLKARFPDNPSVSELEDRIATQSEG